MKEEELLEEFFALGGNYKNIDKANVLSQKIDKYLSESRKNDVQLLDIKRLLEVASEELNFHDFEEACKIIIPTIKRLVNTDVYKLNLSDIRISQVALTWTRTFEEAHQLAKNALTTLDKYINQEAYIKIKFSIHFNILVRLLKADFMEVDPGKELDRSFKLKDIFEEHLNPALAICEAQGKDYEKYKIVLLIRAALFEREYKIVDAQLEELKKMGEKELYKAMKNSILPYSTYAGSSITEKQLRAMCGANLREFRERAGKTAEEIGKLLGYGEAHITAVERGERGLSLHQLYKIAQTYEISLDTLCHGIIENKISSKIEIAREKLKIESKGLDEHELETLSLMAARMKAQKRRVEKRPYLVSSPKEEN